MCMCVNIKQLFYHAMSFSMSLNCIFIVTKTNASSFTKKCVTENIVFVVQHYNDVHVGRPYGFMHAKYYENLDPPFGPLTEIFKGFFQKVRFPDRKNM